MISNEQARKIDIRRHYTVKAFLENSNSSDEALAEILQKKYGIETSSSTVGRDLSQDVLKTRFGNDICEFIKNKRKENRDRGHVTGGLNSQKEHGFEKDENGKFSGNGHKR